MTDAVVFTDFLVGTFQLDETSATRQLDIRVGCLTPKWESNLRTGGYSGKWIGSVDTAPTFGDSSFALEDSVDACASIASELPALDLLAVLIFGSIW